MKENKRMNLLTMEHITKAYTDRVLLNDVAFSINENEKIGVIGINGMGKSTLLKVTAGIEPYDEGKISMGKQVKICYLPQTPVFEAGTTILRAATEGNYDELNRWTIEAEAKSMLNQLGFTDYAEKIEHMSGGQKKRVALVRALLTPADILVLDEPTNHLDNEMSEWLEEYLIQFRGAILMVTHDRYFLDRVVNRIFAFEGNGVVQQYEGGFTDYQRAWNERHPQISGNGAGAGNAGSGKASDKDTDEENAANAKAVNKNNWKETSGAQKKLRLSYKEQREWETIEGDIAGLEEAIAALETEIEKSASNYTRLNELMKEKTEKEAQLEEKMDRWMYLTDLVKQIESQK